MTDRRSIIAAVIAGQNPETPWANLDFAVADEIIAVLEVQGYRIVKVSVAGSGSTRTEGGK